MLPPAKKISIIIVAFVIAGTIAAAALFHRRPIPPSPLLASLTSIAAECENPRSLQNLQDIYFSFRTNFTSITPSADDRRRFAALSKSIDRSILLWKAKDFITNSGYDYARAASPQIKEALDSIDATFWPAIYIGSSHDEPTPIFYPGPALAHLLEDVRAQATDWRPHPPTP